MSKSARLGMPKLARFVTLLFALAISLPTPHTHAQEISTDRLFIYIQSDTVKMDVQIDSLFTQRTLDAIESGMTASIAVHFRIVASPGNRVSVEKEINHRLEHDIWEGTYRLIHVMETTQDTLMSKQFDVINKACADLQGIPLTLLSTLPKDRSLTLQARLLVNPITPEQQARTRRWLKILKKGSLLDFFFSFDNPVNTQRWIDLITFRPAALPYFIRGNKS